jgi:hypothetical protein
MIKRLLLAHFLGHPRVVWEHLGEENFDGVLAYPKMLRYGFVILTFPKLMIMGSYVAKFPPSNIQGYGKNPRISLRCNRPQYILRLALNSGGNKTECLQQFFSHTSLFRPHLCSSFDC